ATSSTTLFPYTTLFRSCCEPNSPQGESTMSAVMKEPQISRPVAQFVATAKKLLIDGKWLPAASEKTFEVKNPANGATIARAAERSEEHTSELQSRVDLV